MLTLWPGDFLTSWCFFLRSCLFNRIGHPWKPSCLCSGKCVWPSATPPPTSIPKHPTLFFTFGLLHFLILASHKIWYSVKLSQTDCENQLFLRYVRIRKGQTWARQVYHYYLTATLSLGFVSYIMVEYKHYILSNSFIWLELHLSSF